MDAVRPGRDRPGLRAGGGAGANTVRLIVPAHAFGYPEPEPAMTGRLERVVGIAARRGLRMELTLFDWWHVYADVAGSRRWAAAVLSPYAGDARIAFVELKNELRPQDEGASAWAAALIPYVREVTRKPVTISVPALEPARDLGLLRSALGTAQPDFYSAHFYWRPELLAAHLDAAGRPWRRCRFASPRRGTRPRSRTTSCAGCPQSPSAREAQQAYYLRSVAAVARRLGLPPIAPWVLSDFSRDAIPPGDPGVYGNAQEYRFGVFRVSGEAKPAAAALRRIFSGGRSRGFNGGFEDVVRDERGGSVPALWRIRPAHDAVFSRDAQIVRSGRGSARIDGTGRDRARRRVRDRATRPGGRAGRPLDAHGVRARRHALRRGAGGAALVRGRPPRGRRERSRGRFAAVAVAGNGYVRQARRPPGRPSWASICARHEPSAPPGSTTFGTPAYAERRGLRGDSAPDRPQHRARRLLG